MTQSQNTIEIVFSQFFVSYCPLQNVGAFSGGATSKAFTVNPIKL